MYTMILDGSFPNDIRVRKEADSISNHGKSLMVICRWKKGELRTEMIGNTKVYRIGKDYTHTRKGINDILMSLFFIDFGFAKNVRQIMKKENITAFHIHDLPLLKTILRIKGNIPIIVDMHENYPEMLITLNQSNKSKILQIKDSLFFNFKRWKKYEKKYIHRIDHIIAVIDEMKAKFIREYAIDPAKITVISNYEKLDFSQSKVVDDFLFDPSVFYIVYVGGIEAIRGLNTVIESLPKFNKLNKKVEFVIVGGGNSNYIHSLKQLAIQLECDTQVHFLGYKNFEKINYYMTNSNLNVIPHIKNEHTDNTIPHKLFQIMTQKSPVIVSSCTPMKRIIEDNDAGFVFEASNSANFVEVVLEFMENDALVATRVENAFNAVKTQYNWDRESEKLIELYNSYNG